MPALTRAEKLAAGAKRSGGGPFGDVDRLLAAFFEARKKFRAAVKERLGAARTLRSVDGLYAVRWKGVTYRAPTPELLLEKLPKKKVPGE
jgi:hypothetical protein